MLRISSVIPARFYRNINKHNITWICLELRKNATRKKIRVEWIEDSGIAEYMLSMNPRQKLINLMESCCVLVLMRLCLRVLILSLYIKGYFSQLILLKITANLVSDGRKSKRFTAWLSVSMSRCESEEKVEERVYACKSTWCGDTFNSHTLASSARHTLSYLCILFTYFLIQFTKSPSSNAILSLNRLTLLLRTEAWHNYQNYGYGYHGNHQVPLALDPLGKLILASQMSLFIWHLILESFYKEKVPFFSLQLQTDSLVFKSMEQSFWKKRDNIITS